MKLSHEFLLEISASISMSQFFFDNARYSITAAPLFCTFSLCLHHSLVFSLGSSIHMYECFLFSPGMMYFFLCEKLDEYHGTAEDAY